MGTEGIQNGYQTEMEKDLEMMQLSIHVSLFF